MANNTVAYGAKGTTLNVATPSSPQNVAYPTGITAGQMLLLFANSDRNSLQFNLSASGWAHVNASPHTDAATNDSLVLWKEASGSESGNLSVTVTNSPTTLTAFIARFTTSGSGAWEIQAAGGSDATVNTSWAPSFSSGDTTMNLDNGDLLIAHVTGRLDAAVTWSSETIEGISATQRENLSGPGTNTIQIHVSTASVTSNLGDQAISHAATLGTSMRGINQVVRLRHASLAVTHRFFQFFD